MTPIIVPGLQGSCGAHWQTWLQCRLPGSRRVEQPDWDSPDLDRWSTVLRRDVQLGCGNAVIIAHSFGCLAAIDVLQRGCARVAAALWWRRRILRTSASRTLGLLSGCQCPRSSWGVTMIPGCHSSGRRLGLSGSVAGCLMLAISVTSTSLRVMDHGPTLLISWRRLRDLHGLILRTSRPAWEVEIPIFHDLA